MHSSHATHGGDLKTDTVAIIGATLDLQEKVVKQVKTVLAWPSEVSNTLLTGDDPHQRRLYAFD